jgi:hypothetical protein
MLYGEAMAFMFSIATLYSHLPIDRKNKIKQNKKRREEKRREEKRREEKNKKTISSADQQRALLLVSD